MVDRNLLRSLDDDDREGDRDDDDDERGERERREDDERDEGKRRDVDDRIGLIRSKAREPRATRRPTSGRR